jgi:hypothetical protein
MFPTRTTSLAMGRREDAETPARRTPARRRLLAEGERLVFNVWYRPTDDGYDVNLVELGAHIKVTGRKGIERAARDRIALQLELPQQAFELNIRRMPRSRSSKASRGDS